MSDRTRLVISIVAALVSLGILLGVVVYFRVPLLEFIPTPPVVVTQADEGTVVSLLQGQRLAVQLPGNANSGSVWRVGIPVSFLPQEGDATFTLDRNPKTAGDGFQVTTFRATGRGTGPLFLDYSSGGAIDSKEPVRAFRITVSVK